MQKVVKAKNNNDDREKQRDERTEKDSLRSKQLSGGIWPFAS